MEVASAATGGQRPEIAVRRSGGARRIGTIGGCDALRHTAMLVAGRGECFGTSDAPESRERSLRRAAPTSSRASNRFGGGSRESGGAGLGNPLRRRTGIGANEPRLDLLRQAVFRARDRDFEKEAFGPLRRSGDGNGTCPTS
jgi:hypothetical protein